jgi:hypothetical protein
MKGILESAKEQRKIISFVALFLFLLSALAAQPVVAQAPYLSWVFDYSPLVSGAPNTVQITIQNTGLAPLRLSLVGIQFSWTQAATYLSTAESQSTVDIPPEQEVNYTIPFTVPADLGTGRYSMYTLVQYQIWQTPQFGGVEPLVYALDVIVLGRTWSYSLSFDPYDGRFYSAIAVFTLLGWYLPKKLRAKAKG